MLTKRYKTIEIEGLSGAGKTTVSKSLIKELENKGFHVITDIDKSQITSIWKHLLLPNIKEGNDNLEDIFFIMRFLEDYYYLKVLSKIKKIKSQKIIIFKDRGFSSIFAYLVNYPEEEKEKKQTLYNKLIKDWNIKINRKNRLVLFINTPTDIAANRRQETNKIHQKTFNKSTENEKVINEFLQMKSSNWVIIDGKKDKETIFKDSMNAICKHFNIA